METKRNVTCLFIGMIILGIAELVVNNNQTPLALAAIIGIVIAMYVVLKVIHDVLCKIRYGG